MLDPEMPLIYGIVVLTVIVGLQRLFVHLTEHNRLFEHLLESDPSRLVKDGVMDVKNMHKEGFSRDDLFLSLRDKGIEHLGEVKGAFLETSGKVSVWTRSENEVEPGLPLIPIVDKDCPIPFPKGDSAKMAEYCSCSHCGYTLFFREDEKFCECPNCHSECWIPSSMQRARELEKNALS